MNHQLNELKLERNSRLEKIARKQTHNGGLDLRAVWENAWTDGFMQTHFNESKPIEFDLEDLF